MYIYILYVESGLSRQSWVTRSGKESMRGKYGLGTTQYISRMGSSRVPSITRAMFTCRDYQFRQLRATSIFVQLRPASSIFNHRVLPLPFPPVPRERWLRGVAPELEERPSPATSSEITWVGRVPLTIALATLSISLDPRSPDPYLLSRVH